MPDASTIARLSALPGVDTASGVASAAEDAELTGRVLPVSQELARLLPWGGLRRGSTVAVRDSTSLLLALLADATAAGSWAAVVGIPQLGLVAARELGVAVHRLGLVPSPGAEFAAVTAALLDGVDLVAVAPAEGQVGGQLQRRLSARARHRGAVLLSLGAWQGADVQLSCVAGSWSGLQGGYGYLTEREVAVRSVGRGAAARPVRVRVRVPGPGGSLAPAKDGAGSAEPFDSARIRERRGA